MKVLYSQNVYDQHIAHSIINLKKLFENDKVSDDWHWVSGADEPFSIRSRAILDNNTSTKYSEWMEFHRSVLMIDSTGAESFTEIEYNERITAFWNQHKDINNDRINLEKWISIFCKHEKVMLNENELKRIYFYLCCKRDSYQGVDYDSFFRFARDDIYREMSGWDFVSHEWCKFRKAINCIKYC